MEVIGGISTVIGLLDTSIELFKRTQKDLKLSETIETVGRQLPIIHDTLEGCQKHLQPRIKTIPEDVAEALEKTLDACEIKANNLKKIFAKIIPNQSSPWQTRYAAIVRRLGKGSKVEELMKAITEDVQIIVNHQAVKSADSQQNVKLEQILRELESLESSLPEDDASGMNFTSHGGPQHNYVHRGHGAYHVNSGSGKQYNAEHQNFVVEAPEDFSFHEPAGFHLGRAPFIATELFVGREKELNTIAETLQPVSESQEQQRLVLGGMGGIGKTQLAIAYAKSHHHSYNSVFWLNAESAATMTDSFLSIAKQIFKLQQPDKLKGEEAITHVCQWLSDPKNPWWLLILDNYDNPDAYKIEQYYPLASHGVLLITTRQPSLVAGKKILVQPLKSIEDGLMILQSRSKRESTGTGMVHELSY
ncbi:P-loop containing nucleoside triphosphate hydrolase protein [Aspergillus venezuelensis]